MRRESWGHYDWLDKDEAYAARFADADADVTEALEAEARRRARLRNSISNARVLQESRPTLRAAHARTSTRLSLEDEAVDVAVVVFGDPESVTPTQELNFKCACSAARSKGISGRQSITRADAVAR